MILRVGAMDGLTVDVLTARMTNTTDNMTLIVGGTGKTGRRVAERLQGRGLPTRIGSRSAQPPFDWEERSTWLPALQGATAAYLTYFPDLAIPGAAEAVGELSQLAVDNGVRRLVLLSGRGEEEAQNAERAMQASGADWTVVRCSWFAQNFSEGYLAEPVIAGEVALPVGETPEPFVDADDIADVVTVALTEPGHVGEVYELTGPRALSFAQAIGEIAEATGRPVRFVPVTMDEFAAAMAAQEVPDDVVWLLRYLFTEVLDGRNVEVMDGIERALGRPPRDFREYARRAAAAGHGSAHDAPRACGRGGRSARLRPSGGRP
jgi:uncharacterized protein YbjT (DUF2867 family)